MKFENIEVGMKLQHKKNGRIYKVIGSEEGLFDCSWFTLNKSFIGCCKDETNLVGIHDAKLFRKYKEVNEINSN